MAARADTNQCCRHVAYDMAKSIQISRVTSANTTHSTKILAVNRKQLSNNIIDPLLFLWYLRVGSVKAEPQRPKYPNLSVRSFVRSKKLILEFYSVAKMVQYIGHLFACTHNSLSSRLPSGCARNLLPPHLPGARNLLPPHLPVAWQGRQAACATPSPRCEKAWPPHPIHYSLAWTELRQLSTCFAAEMWRTAAKAMIICFCSMSFFVTALTQSVSCFSLKPLHSTLFWPPCAFQWSLTSPLD